MRPRHERHAGGRALGYLREMRLAEEAYHAEAVAHGQREDRTAGFHGTALFQRAFDDPAPRRGPHFLAPAAAVGPHGKEQVAGPHLGRRSGTHLFRHARNRSRHHDESGLNDAVARPRVTHLALVQLARQPQRRRHKDKGERPAQPAPQPALPQRKALARLFPACVGMPFFPWLSAHPSLVPTFHHNPHRKSAQA